MCTDLYEDMYKTEETHWRHRAKRTAVSTILKTIRGDTPLKILDVGCGTGKNLGTSYVFIPCHPCIIDITLSDAPTPLSS